jgi:hypothetical protein
VENDVDVPSKSKQQKAFWPLEGHRRKEQDPDTFFRGTDPGIWIRTKMSRIRDYDSRGRIARGSN